METLVKTTVPTVILQDLVSRAVKGSSMIEKLALTCLMLVKVENNKLVVSTTDNVNQVVVWAEVRAVDFEVVVDSKLFSATIAKLTTEETSLIIEGNKLTIQANGSYNIALPTDSDGSKIRFPEPYIIENQPVNRITVQEVSSIMDLSRGCKAEHKEMPSLFNYYADKDNIITTDFYKICYNKIKLFNEPTCITPSLMNLLPCVVDDNGVSVTSEGDNVMFFSSKGRVCGKKALQEELESYPVEDLTRIMNEQLPYTCLVNRSLLLAAIDRLLLYVDAYNSNKLTIIFGKKQLTLLSDSTNSKESLFYLKELQEDFEDFSIDVEAVFLKNLINSCSKEELPIKFGIDSGVMIEFDNCKLLLSVLGEE